MSIEQRKFTYLPKNRGLLSEANISSFIGTSMNIVFVEGRSQ